MDALQYSSAGNVAAQLEQVRSCISPGYRDASCERIPDDAREYSGSHCYVNRWVVCLQVRCARSRIVESYLIGRIVGYFHEKADTVNIFFSSRKLTLYPWLDRFSSWQHTGLDRLVS